MNLTSYYHGVGGVDVNGAAVVGLLICYGLLVSWMREKAKQYEDKNKEE